MANEVNIKTIIVPTGTTYTTSDGCRSIDFIYYGTVDLVRFTGLVEGSQPIPIPPSVPYTLEYNDNGYASVLVSNGGDANCYIVEKW